MDRNPAAYRALLGKILPTQLTGGADGEGPITICWKSDIRDYTREELNAIISTDPSLRSATEE